MSPRPRPIPAPAPGSGPSGSAEVSEAESIAAAVLGVPDVLAMSSGPVGQFRSYLPGGASVPGVRIDDDLLTVNVVCRYGPALPELGEQVAAALGPLLAGRDVTVAVDDIVLPGEAEPDRADSLVDPASGPAPAPPRPLGPAGSGVDS